MECVVICTCGMGHKAQCRCELKVRKKKKYKYVCRGIRVLPRCCQFHPDLPVKVVYNKHLDKRTGEIVERKIYNPKRKVKNDTNESNG